MAGGKSSPKLRFKCRDRVIWPSHNNRPGVVSMSAERIEIGPDYNGPGHLVAFDDGLIWWVRDAALEAEPKSNTDKPKHE